jgi:hypothetical protein
MTKFTNFDRQNLKALRSEMQALLEKYGVKSNLEVKVGNMSFSDAEVSIKVNAKVKGAVTIEDKILLMEVKDLGLTMTNSLGETLVKYNTRARKMPFVYSDANGKMYKCCMKTAQMRFGKNSRLAA